MMTFDLYKEKEKLVKTVDKLNERLKKKYEESVSLNKEYLANLTENQNLKMLVKAMHGEITRFNEIKTVKEDFPGQEEMAKRISALEKENELLKSQITVMSADLKSNALTIEYLSEENPNNYQKLAFRTAGDKTFEEYILNGALGLTGEAGEVADIIKKWKFQGHELDVEKMVDELGDVCWYIALISNALSIDLSEIFHRNIEKLKARYPDGFDPERSVNRAESK